MFQFIKNSKLLKSSIIYIATDAVNKAIPFLILPIITKYLTPSEFGVVSNFIILFTILTTIVGVNVDGAISSNFFQMPKHRLRSFIGNALILILFSFIICFLIIIILNNQIYSFSKIPLKYMLLATITAYFQVVTMINLALWRLEEEPLKFGFYQISQTILNVSISLILIIIFNKSWQGRADGYIYSISLFGLISIFILNKRNYLSKIKLKKAFITKLLRFGLPLIPHTIGIWIRTSADRFILTNQIGESAAGIYSTGAQFGILLSFLTIAFNNAYIPYLYKNLSNKNIENTYIIDRKLVKLTYGTIAIYFILSIVTIILSIFFIGYLLPPSYSDSKDLIIWIVFTQFFQGCYFLMGNYIFYAQKTKYLASITLIVSILHFIMCWFFVEIFGMIGAAYASFASGGIYFLSVWYYSNKVYPMPWFWER